MTTLATIGELLRQARLRQQVSKSALSASAGIHRNTVHLVELGRANVELNTLIALCDALDLSIVLVPNEVREHTMPVEGQRQSALSRLLDERLGSASPLPARQQGGAK